MSGQPGDIRIADLADPVLTPLQKAAIEGAGQMPVTFTAEAVLGEAMKQTGLSDFGADDFRERLGVWLASVEEDTDLGPVGRVGVFRDIVRYAANRLRFEDLLKRRPEILDVEIRRPIIVAGLPRSGTTHLLNLIAADRRLRSLPYWESLEPIPAPNEAPEPDGEDPRLARCRKASAMQDALMPLLKNMHHMTPEHVHEEIELQALDFSSYELEWIATVPRWRDYYLAHDQRPHYEYLKKVLKALQWLRGPDRWVLKSPQHMEQLGPLRATLPDATIAITHRDPVSVIASAVTMLAYGDRLRRRRVDPPAVAAYWIDRIERLLRACVRDVDRIAGEERNPPRFDNHRDRFRPIPSFPRKRESRVPRMDPRFRGDDKGRAEDQHVSRPSVIHVLFHEFMADDVGMVERVYDLAGLPMTAAARAALERFMAENPRGKHGRIVYDLKADFGVDPDELRRRFAFYYERFPVQIE